MRKARIEVDFTSAGNMRVDVRTSMVRLIARCWEYTAQEVDQPARQPKPI